MTLDFNDAPPQKSFDVIPAGTVATLQLKIRPGNAGAGGWLRRSKAGDSEALDCEFVVIDGEYAKRRFWTLMTVAGTTEGHADAAAISLAKLRGILESARGINPNDQSEAAKQARRTESYGDFDGLRFIGRIGVKAAENNYAAKNILLEAITPDRRDWRKVEQALRVAGPSTSTKPAATNAPAIQRWRCGSPGKHPSPGTRAPSLRFCRSSRMRLTSIGHYPLLCGRNKPWSVFSRQRPP